MVLLKLKRIYKEKLESFENNNILPEEERFDGYADRCIAYGLHKSLNYFNPRQLLTLVTYVEIINEAKSKLQFEYEPEKVNAIATYLALVLDRCADVFTSDYSNLCSYFGTKPNSSTIPGFVGRGERPFAPTPN